MAAQILFRAKESSSGFELWITDGTTNGTSALTYYDSVNHTYSVVQSPLYLTSLGDGKMVFSAYSATDGQELWVTDGTSAGTKLLVDINSGSNGSFPGGNKQAGIAYLGNSTHQAVFSAEDGSTYITDLWVTDGTANSAGQNYHTYMLGDTKDSILQGTTVVPTNPLYITALGDGKALFTAEDSTGTSGYEIWVTNGTSAGTYMLNNIFYSFASSNPEFITPIGNGKALFAANTATDANHKYGTELWISGGTKATTTLLKNINPDTTGTYSSNPHGFAVLGSEVLFAADNGTNGTELWITDGTTPGTTLLKDINPGSAPSDPSDITPLGNGEAVFAADNGTDGTELWITNGTSGGTVLLQDINSTDNGSGGTQPSFPHDITYLGGGTHKAVFAANDGTNGEELWVTDGIAGAGHTYMLYTNKHYQLAYGVNSSSPLFITAIGGGEALFQATYAKDSTHKYGIELFITDGTSAGTKFVKDIYPDTLSIGSSYPSGFAVLTPVCFCRGTLIRTDKGEVAVEALAIGDRVKTLSGAFKPIRWIGFGRDLVTRKNPLARPIIVRRGALADNVPRRDLYLTHGHALYLDGMLIPVENLVNHRSILWDDTARAVEYYHIELDGHDVVLAEGAPAESYHDAGNRARFQNARPGSAAGAATPTYAPVLNGGAVVKKIWAALFARSGGKVEVDTTDDPDLHLVVDGERRDPASHADGVYTFTLDRPPAGPLRLCSRSSVPSLMGLSETDHRRLGVAIKQLIAHRPGVMTCFAHDAALFVEGGGYGPENGHSWTDGDLDLPAALFAHMRGAFTLIVHTQRHCMRYPIAAEVAEAA